MKVRANIRALAILATPLTLILGGIMILEIFDGHYSWSYLQFLLVASLVWYIIIRGKLPSLSKSVE